MEISEELKDLDQNLWGRDIDSLLSRQQMDDILQVQVSLSRELLAEAETTMRGDEIYLVSLAVSTYIANLPNSLVPFQTEGRYSHDAVFKFMTNLSRQYFENAYNLPADDQGFWLNPYNQVNAFRLLGYIAISQKNEVMTDNAMGQDLGITSELTEESAFHTSRGWFPIDLELTIREQQESFHRQQLKTTLVDMSDYLIREEGKDPEEVSFAAFTEDTNMNECPKELVMGSVSYEDGRVKLKLIGMQYTFKNHLDD
jgi:hypothetical protein